MLTPQEVSTHAFTKAVMGGYNMAMVDEFLDELTEDYTSLYKENATLKAKLKVLVEKVEEYRATEDSMRATLLTAQRMADSMVHEAESRRDALVAQAEKDTQARRLQLEQETKAVEARLRMGQEELAKFIFSTREFFNRELQFLEQLPQAAPEQSSSDLAEEAPKADAAPVEEIEARVLASFQTPPKEEEAASPEAAPQAEPEVDPFTGEAAEPTRRINLDDLKFGRNYTGGT